MTRLNKLKILGWIEQYQKETSHHRLFLFLFPSIDVYTPVSSRTLNRHAIYTIS